MTMINADIERSAFGSNRRSWEYFDAQLTSLRVNDVENIVARTAAARGQGRTEARLVRGGGQAKPLPCQRFAAVDAHALRVDQAARGDTATEAQGLVEQLKTAKAEIGPAQAVDRRRAFIRSQADQRPRDCHRHDRPIGGLARDVDDRISNGWQSCPLTI